MLLEIKGRWQGGYIITKSDDRLRPFLFRPKGIFKSGYQLLNYKDEVLLEIMSDFSWKKFTQNYSITCEDNFDLDEFEKLMTMLSVHFFRAMQNAAGAGTT